MIMGILRVVDIILMLYTVYYIAMALFTFTNRKLVKKYENKNKFAIIIPARDEEKVIGNLIDSLNSQNYPEKLYDIYVLPNNCTDNTKQIAISKNANIIELYYQVKCKGEVLKYAFDYLKNKDYNAYLIFDADNIVHPNFIKEMNSTLNNGYEIAQGYRDSKNPKDTWISSCYSLHYMVHNTFINKSRNNIRKSCFINGTGFMISKKIVEENTYNPISITEDIELSIQLAMENQKIAFVEDAITYDEQTTKLKTSYNQRKRWSSGTIQCLYAYGKELIKSGIKQRNFESIDALMFLIAPFVQLASTFMCIIGGVVALISKEYTWYANHIGLGILIYGVSILGLILLVKMNKKHIRIYIKGILTFPIFVLTWIPVNVMAVLKPKIEWKKIEHTRNINIENILEIQYSGHI